MSWPVGNLPKRDAESSPKVLESVGGCPGSRGWCRVKPAVLIMVIADHENALIPLSYYCLE